MKKTFPAKTLDEQVELIEIWTGVRLLASVPMSLLVTDFIKEIISIGISVTQFLQINVNSSTVIYKKFNRNIMSLTKITKAME